MPEREKSIIDPFWRVYGNIIWRFTKDIEFPRTQAGEEVLGGIFDLDSAGYYPRLWLIFGSLVALLEFDEIGRQEGKKYFSDPFVQRITIKAFGLFMERIIRDPYSPDEKSKYGDYLPFYESLLSKLRQFDERISSGEWRGANKFVDSLVFMSCGSVGKLKKIKKFDIDTKAIRSHLSDYLPSLQQIDQGKVYRRIRKQIAGLAGLVGESGRIN